MLERAQTAVEEICHSFGMRSLRRGRESARSDSNLLDLLDKSWFGPQQAAGAADEAEAGCTYHVRPRLHMPDAHEPIAQACAATSPHGSTQPRPVSQCGQAASRRGDESLAPSVFAMSISLDTVSPLSWASPPRQAPAPEPHRPTPRSTLTMQIQAEQLLAPHPDPSPAPAQGGETNCDEQTICPDDALAQDSALVPDLVLDILQGSEAINVHKEPALWVMHSFHGSATAAVAATLTHPRDLPPASPSGYVAPTSQSLIHPQQPQQQLSMPSISMPLLPILMAKPSAQQRPDDAAVPSLFPVAGSLGASLLFPIAAAAKSMRLRSMQGSESLQGTLLECFAGGHVSTSAPLFQAPTLASPLGLEAAAAAALGSAKHAEEQAQIQAQVLRNLRSSGLGQDASPAPGSCSSSAAAASAGPGPIGSDRINSFWRGLAAAAAAVDGNNVPTKAGPRGDQADTVIPWTSPMLNGATATAEEGMC